MTQFVYRLQLLLGLKEEARDEREKELRLREKEVEAQKTQLQSLQRRVKDMIAKREQLRLEAFSPGSGGSLAAQEAQQRFEYIKAFGLQIEEAKNDVSSQRLLVEQYEARVRQAQRQVEEANREVEVLKKHRSKQEERFLRELQAKEDLALDEIGNVLYSTRRRPS
jgi:flagellar biosynthesis chaperone FliJ